MKRSSLTKCLMLSAMVGAGSFAFLRGSPPLTVSRETTAAIAVEPTPVEAGAQGAPSASPSVAPKAIAAFRDRGPDGLKAVLGQYDQSHDDRLLPVIDAVAAQHDAVWSRLYWYTDLDRAKAAAAAQNKPILYLRLMGNLTDEYSCANSRFFRTALYANHDVSTLLRDQYILFWSSERPVPVATIDYGDGRVLKRTITGNSIHYVLTPTGDVIDALPGLYGPKTFAAILGAARIAATAQVDRRNIAPDYPGTTKAELLRCWNVDRTRAGVPSFVGADPAPARIGQAPEARAAMRRAVSKTAVEGPMVRRIAMNPVEPEAADAALWLKIADLHLSEARLDVSSIALLRSKNPAAYAEADALQRTVERFEKNIALDTVHNEYDLRPRILGWLREAKQPIDLEALNRRVYSELFLTPRTDPWLGLAPEATYTALPADGLSRALPISAYVSNPTESQTIDFSIYDCAGPKAAN